MNILESFRVAMRGLTNNKMRTALTMLGIIIGVGVVILVVAIGEGASARIADTVNSLGTNLLTVQANRNRVKLNAATSSTATTTTATATASQNLLAPTNLRLSTLVEMTWRVPVKETAGALWAQLEIVTP